MATADEASLLNAAPATAPAPEMPAEPAALPKIFGLTQTPGMRTLLLSIGGAVIIAIMAGMWMWTQQTVYKVLFANFNDKDGGAIVAILQQMNVPYKYSESGNAIMVPENQVHDARLKLAAQGLPKAGNVGFELMENQKLGTSHFLEQINFQRALEGELARSIQTVSSVQTARVHLAIPKSSVFVREQLKPTASLVLTLYPERTLDKQQIKAILHLVASSVPELSSKNVTIVDQDGNFLSDPDKNLPTNTLEPAQIKYVQDYQQNITRRVESLLSPIFGARNVKAEATADIDFSRSEQAAESYRPNSPPELSSIRSAQSSEIFNKSTSVGGIPGALSNQPPVPATAPITTGGANPASATSTGVTQKDSTINYEVDKTIRYTKQIMGGVKRLTVGVVVNYKSETDKNGKVTYKPLTDVEKDQITELVKEAMGYNKERGDTVNVVNSQFAPPEKDNEIELPLWKQPEMVQLAKEIGKYLLTGIVILYLFFGYLRPILYKIMGKKLPSEIKAEEAARKKAEEEEAIAKAKEAEELAKAQEESEESEEDAIVTLSEEAAAEEEKVLSEYEMNMEMVKQLAMSDARIVANVIKAWVNNE